jgi:ribosomal protein S18 acetylase RimI-like enzyme
MAEVRLRAMTEPELEAYLRHAISDYATAHVSAGSWAAEGAEERSAAEFAQLLPEGLATENMLLYMAEASGGEVVGWVWLCLTSPRGDRGFAWIYDIEVVADQRGRGYGRALLAAAEAELRSRDVPAVALNVFGPNVVAQRLYATAGFELMSQQLRKQLS